MVWKHDIRLGCKGLRLKAKDAGQIDYCQLGKLDIAGHSGERPTQTEHVANFQAFNRVLAFVEGGNGVDVQIHAKAVAELIGDQLGIDTGLTRKTGMRASAGVRG